MNPFNLETCIVRMEANLAAFQGLWQGVTTEQARWKPDAESWSMLEVVNHLYDEEREDFRTRVHLALTAPNQPWPPIDPQGWVTSRAYQSRDWQESIVNFLNERAQSVTWLRTLHNPDWQRSSIAPWGGEIGAGDLMASWVAHDWLHLRQIVELQYGYTAYRSQPFVVEYAGDW